MNIGKYSSTSNAYLSITARDGYLSNANFGDITLQNEVGTGKIKFSGGAASTAQMTLTAAGRLLLGQTSEGTQRLQVTGDTLMTGSGATSATIGLQVQNSASANLLRVQNNGIVSIGEGPSDTLATNGQVILKLNSLTSYWTIQNRENAGLEFLNPNYAGTYSFFTLTDARNTSSSQTNALFQRFFTQNSVNNRTFINVELRGDINQTGGATGISRGFYVNHTITAAADWRSIEWSNNSGWGLYGAGTANNYLAGSLGIGTTTPSDILDIRKNQVTTNVATTTSVLLSNTNASGIAAYVFTSDGTTRQGGLQYNNTTGSRNLFSVTYTNIPYYFGTNGLIRLTINGDTGNVSIGSTSDSGEKLQVTGSAKISLNQNSDTGITISNNNINASAYSRVSLTSNSGTGHIYKLSSVYTGYKTLGVSDFSIFNSLSGDISLLNDIATGNIKFAAGGSSTVQMTLTSAGSLGIGATSVNASAITQIDSTTKGFLPPRMTNAQRIAISSPAVGLIVYCTDAVEGLYVYKSTGWTFVI
jgi:hypothetical protein